MYALLAIGAIAAIIALIAVILYVNRQRKLRKEWVREMNGQAGFPPNRDTK
jgi:uncharacterized membrane protein